MQQQLSAAISALRNDFVISTASTPGQMKQAFQLRHQVYCLERGYETATPEGVERDEFDRDAKHIIASDRRTGQVVGTVRLILPTKRLGSESAKMPIRRLCDPALLRDVPYWGTAEVSRFAISRERRDIVSKGAPLLRLGLIQAVIQLSLELGFTHLCAVMEPSLLRLLRASAIRFAPIGAPVEYHGLRQPCFAEIDTVLTEMAAEQPQIFDLITEGGRLWEPRLLAA